MAAIITGLAAVVTVVLLAALQFLPWSLQCVLPRVAFIRNEDTY